MEFLISWVGFPESENSALPFDNLLYNMVFLEYINSYFKTHEYDIFVTIANVKEKIKKHIRKALVVKKKVEIMHEEVGPFDPKELRAYLVFYHQIQNPPVAVERKLERYIYRSYFFEMEKIQRLKHDKFIEEVKRIDKDVDVSIENDEDFEVLPISSDFTYIKKNFLADDVNTTMSESFIG